MRNRQVITIAAVFLLRGTIPAHANPTVLDVYGMSDADSLSLFIAVSALLVEYLVVRQLLHPWARFRHVAPSFLLINVISFPLTTMLAMVFAWVAEIVPLVIEPLMYKWYLRAVGVEVPNLRARIIGANLVSFALGAVASHAVPYWRGP